MATLVLSTVGTSLGGPVGGAIGSLVGQSIDQQLLGGGLRRGPRLGDLAVQTSTYGSDIPRIYGTMRVAGSVVWATDLKESSTLVGAKGQPQSKVYSYSVSMAVALSSRPVRSIKRIWADGKLLRGAAGDFKVRTGFRFHHGSEDQPVDPLIASLEGMTKTPAYRGLALAVFEDLELSEFGNRIPFLTFEIEADQAKLPVAYILSDVSGGLIACSGVDAVSGYAAHGADIGSTVEPLVNCFGIDLFDDGQVLGSGSTDGPEDIGQDRLGCGSEDTSARVERSVVPAENLPASVMLTYYDAQRDYQTGQQRASTGHPGPELRVQAPAVLAAIPARSIAETMLARQWARRERLTVRVPPAYLKLRQGQLVTIRSEPKLWRVQRCTIDAGGVRLDLCSTETRLNALSADHGRSAPTADVVASPTILALFDIPSVNGGSEPGIHVAAASASAGWKTVGLRIDTGGDPVMSSSAPRQTIMGHSLQILGVSEPALLDESNSVDVQLVDAADWLTSCDHEALLRGTNLAVLGDEIFQFGSAQQVGPGAFRLSHLLRGRHGTEWAVQAHVEGEPFALLQTDSLRMLPLSAGLRGSLVAVSALGLADTNAQEVSKIFTCERLRPASPVHLKVENDVNGSLRVTWIRRSRTHWDWVDELEVPLDETAELYRVLICRGAQALSLETNTSAITISASNLSAFGAGPAEILVSQVGDRGVSHPTSISFEIP